MLNIKRNLYLEKILLSQYQITPPLRLKLIHESTDNETFLIIYDFNNKKKKFRISKRSVNKSLIYELELIKQLTKEKIPLAKWIPTKDNKPFIVLRNGKKAVLFDYIPGKPIKIDVNNKPHLKKVAEAGKGLGRLHDCSSKIEIKKLEKRTIFTELDRVLQKQKSLIKKYQDGKNFIKQIKEYKNWVQLNKQIIGIIHNDYRPQNILFDKSKLTAILDFDWACTGPLIKDLALALVEWSFPDGTEKFWRDVFDQFLISYNQTAPFRIQKNNDLYHWICFSCLSEAATYFSDLNGSGSDKKSITSSYMYEKFIFFKNNFLR